MPDFYTYHPLPGALVVGISAETVYGADRYDYVRSGQFVCVGMGVCASGDTQQAAIELWERGKELRERRIDSARQRVEERLLELEIADRRARIDALLDAAREDEQREQAPEVVVRRARPKKKQFPKRHVSDISPFPASYQSSMECVVPYSLPDEICEAIRRYDLEQEVSYA